MSDKIKAAAEGRYPLTRDLTEQSIANYKRMAFIAGAEYFLKESGVEELREVVRVLMKMEFHDQINAHKNILAMVDTMGLIKAKAKVDGALAACDSFFNDKNLKDGK